MQKAEQPRKDEKLTRLVTLVNDHVSAEADKHPAPDELLGPIEYLFNAGWRICMDSKGHRKRW